MSDSRGLSFRSAFNGYNRDDVNKYIEEVNIQFKKNDENAKKTITTLSKELEAAKAEKNNSNTDNNSVSPELEALKEENASLKAANEQLSKDKSAEIDNLKTENQILAEENKMLKDENAALKSNQVACSESAMKVVDEIRSQSSSPSEQESLRGEIEKLKAENSALKEKLDNSTANADVPSGDGTKAEMYDQVKNQLGTVILDARQMADTITANAKADAEKKMRECGDKERRVNEIIQMWAKRAISDCNGEYIKYINSIRDSFDRMIEENNASHKQVLDEINKITGDNTKNVEEEVNSIIQ